MTQCGTVQIVRAAPEWSGVPRGREARTSFFGAPHVLAAARTRNVRAAWSVLFPESFSWPLRGSPTVLSDGA